MPNWRKMSLAVPIAADVLCVVHHQASGVGVDTLDGKHLHDYVTDDMLENADEDPNSNQYIAYDKRNCSGPSSKTCSI